MLNLTRILTDNYPLFLYNHYISAVFAKFNKICIVLNLSKKALVGHEHL